MNRWERRIPPTQKTRWRIREEPPDRFRYIKLQNWNHVQPQVESVKIYAAPPGLETKSAAAPLWSRIRERLGTVLLVSRQPPKLLPAAKGIESLDASGAAQHAEEDDSP